MEKQKSRGVEKGEEEDRLTSNLLDAHRYYNDTAYEREVETQRVRLRMDSTWAGEGDVCAEAFAKHFLPHVCRRGFSRMHRGSFRRYDRLSDVGDRGSRVSEDTFFLTRRRGDAEDAKEREASPAGTLAMQLPLGGGRSGSREARSMALAAPRGSAKSTIHSLILPLMDICLRREKYIVIISATAAQARMRLRAIRNELMTNAALKAAFGEAIQPQRPWNRDSLCVNGVRIDAFGALAEMRGITHDGVRPTKIILDDAEHTRRAAVAEGRRQVQQWFDEVVENLGDSTTHLEVVGTILHRDSLLSRLLERTGFDHAKYQSITEWGNATELWDEWQRLYQDAREPEHEECAASFYRENKDAMLRGTAVLWEEREDYVSLRKQLATRGRAAFFKEKQNLPLTAEEVLFNPDTWKWFRFLPNHDLADVPNRMDPVAPPDAGSKNGERLNWTRDLVIYGFLDPASGKYFNKGDFAAIVTVGHHRATNACYVLDVWAERRLPNLQVQQAMKLHQKFKYHKFWFEGNQVQGDFYTELFRKEVDAAKRSGDTVGSRIPFGPHAVTGSKEQRIQKLQPLMESGRVFVNAAVPEEFVVQAEEYPQSRHDDAMDALATCVDLAMTQRCGESILSVGRKTHFTVGY